MCAALLTDFPNYEEPGPTKAPGKAALRLDGAVRIILDRIGDKWTEMS
jgi:hypothetical protein